MTETQEMVNAVIAGLQDKKARRITVANLTHIDDAICQYFIVCTAGAPSQAQALAHSVDDKVREAGGGHPTSVVGLQHSLWVAMDYGEVMVHIFMPEEREFYNLENLWEDAELTDIQDED